jgi:hypothetical protein
MNSAAPKKHERRVNVNPIAAQDIRDRRDGSKSGSRRNVIRKISGKANTLSGAMRYAERRRSETQSRQCAEEENKACIVASAEDKPRARRTIDATQRKAHRKRGQSRLKQCLLL